jgi:muramidase (phage lysozyme)
MKTFKQFVTEAAYKSAEARALLDTIAGSESPDYNTVFGGQKFKDYKKHPEIDVPIPWKPGQTSNAAGRYQFLSTTYNPIAKDLKLKDFSPDSQDRAAWELARRTYGDENKLKQDLRRDPVSAASRLSGQWTSLPGGAERNDATDSFEKRYRSSLSKYDKEILNPPTTKPSLKPTSSTTTPAATKSFTRQVIQDKGGKGGTVSSNTAYKTKLGGVKATSTRGDTGNQVIRANLGTVKGIKDQKVAGSLGGLKGTIDIKGGNKSFTATKPAPAAPASAPKPAAPASAPKSAAPAAKPASAPAAKPASAPKSK